MTSFLRLYGLLHRMSFTVPRWATPNRCVARATCDGSSALHAGRSNDSVNRSHIGQLGDYRTR